MRPHPRPFLDGANPADLPARLSGTPEKAALWEAGARMAEGVLVAPAMRRVMIGRRLLDVSRDALGRIGICAVMVRVKRDRRFFEQARRDLLAVSAFEDCNPSPRPPSFGWRSSGTTDRCSSE